MSGMDWLDDHRLVGVLRAVSADRALAHGRAALDAGLSAVEITFTVPNAPQVIADLVASHPNAAIGAGTLLSSHDVRSAAAAGASFLVSPHLDEELVAAAADAGTLYLPGVSTPSEIMRARKLGCRTVKLFPVAQLGGPAYVRALLGPFPDLDILATGGIAASEVAAYHDAGAHSVGLGSLFGPAPEDTARIVAAMLAGA